MGKSKMYDDQLQLAKIRNSLWNAGPYKNTDFPIKFERTLKSIGPYLLSCDWASELVSV